MGWPSELATWIQAVSSRLPRCASKKGLASEVCWRRWLALDARTLRQTDRLTATAHEYLLGIINGSHLLAPRPRTARKVARLIGEPVERMGDARWIGHILKQPSLRAEAGRKRSMKAIPYAVRLPDVVDRMRCCDVALNTLHPLFVQKV